MRLFNTLFLLLFCAALLQSQTIEVAPFQGNPVLRSFASKEALSKAAIVERMTGVNPLEVEGNRDGGDCPPEFLGNLVASGNSLEIELDTFDLSSDTTTPVLTILNLQDLQFGTAALDTTILLTYFANPGFNGAGIDTVLVLYSQPAGNDTIRVPVHVKRQGRAVIANAVNVDPESVTGYCLDNEINFPKPKACSELIACEDGYDGEGQQSFHFTSYSYPDTCIIYYANRFPGVDTVCVKICDEWAVCDTFKIPFIIKGDTISITPTPFFDDFSSYPGPYPSDQLWLDRDVYINSTLAKDPPSIGMATFDGLDRRGRVHEVINGPGDRLTSKPIDLSGFAASDLVSLRFFVAPKGYGLEPEKTDSLVLEFRNKQQQWVRVHTFQGMDVPLDSIPEFSFYGIQISDPQFLHGAFQFRLTGFVSPGGAGDLWHVDYFYLGPSVNADNSIFKDVAFTAPPTSLLKSYTSMPWRHFSGHVDEELTDHFSAHFYNLFDNPVSLNISGVNYYETTLGIDFNQHFTVDETGANIFQNVPTVRQGTIPAENFVEIKNVLNTQIPDAPFRNLQTEFAFVNTSQSPANLYSPNDTIRLNTPFSNYFAHDDGTAEWQVFLKHANGNGQKMATWFHANVPDTLRAVRIMFPHVNGDIESQVFNLHVWLDTLDSDPVYTRELIRPLFPDNFVDTLQEFTTYVLDDITGNEMPVFIPEGDFYVGIEQVTITTSGVPVGFDVQNPCDCNWRWLEPFNASTGGGGWKKFGSFIQGALMIRPVFGTTQSTSSGTVDVVADFRPVEVYPNPTEGRLRFLVKNGNAIDYKVFIFNELGEAVMQGSSLEEELDLSRLNNGIYFVQLLNGKTGQVFSQRIILAKRP